MQERKSTKVWVTDVFVLLGFNYTVDGATEMLGELLGACVGDYAGLEVGQNVGAFVGGYTGVLVGGKLGISTFGLGLSSTCHLILRMEPEESKLEDPKELSMGFPKGFE